MDLIHDLSHGLGVGQCKPKWNWKICLGTVAGLFERGGGSQ